MTAALFGRAPEIALIEAALERASLGRGGALHIVGEPGIGKTALLRAAEQRLDDRQLAFRTAAADDGDQRRRLAMAAQLLPGVTEAAATDPISAALTAVEQFAARRPVAMLADDVHWADALSLEVWPSPTTGSSFRRVFPSAAPRTCWR